MPKTDISAPGALDRQTNLENAQRARETAATPRVRLLLKSRTPAVEI